MGRREKQNLIIGIVAAAGIALILSGLWVISKEYRFKSYRNDRHHFTIKYPATWHFEENKDGAAVLFYSPIENDLDFFMESVNVVIRDISGKPMNLEEFSTLAIEQMEVVFGDNLITIESNVSTLAKQPAYKYVFIGKGPENDMKFMSVWLISSLNSYQVTYTSLASQYDRYLPKVKKMFKSFRLQ